jgi:hypothetical protein
MSLTKVSYSLINGAPLNVLDFGADPTGADDSTAAIQAAIDAGYDVFFPDGNYKIEGSLTLKNFVRLLGNYGLINTNLVDNNGGVKLIFTGTDTACFKSPSATLQIKYVTVAGLSIVATGTYDWVFNFTAPLQCTFDNVYAETQNTAGGVFYGSYVAGQISWINRFFGCGFGSPQNSTSPNIHFYCSDSFVNGCYFSGGKGVWDQSYGGNLFTNTHFDKTTILGAGLAFFKHPETVAQSGNTTSVTNCYFDENFIGISLNATATTVSGEFFNTTISGCTFRNIAGGGIADITWNASGSFTTFGSAVVGCAMSGYMPSFAFLNTNWQRITFAGNANVDVTNLEYSGVNTPGIIKADNSSLTFRGAPNVTGIFGATDGYVLLGSVTGNTPYIGASLNSSNAATNLSLSTNNTQRVVVKSDGAEFYPFANNAMKLGSASNRWTEVFATNGTINTSDQSEKQQIEFLSDAEKQVATELKGLIKKFKFNSAVTKKGDNARIHVGVIAQDVENAFKSNGLDPEDYGIFCKDIWYTHNDKQVEVDKNEDYLNIYYELDGVVVEADINGDYPLDAVKIIEKITPEKHELKGVRYDELLAFIIAAI